MIQHAGRKIERLVWVGLLVVTTGFLLVYIFAVLRQRGSPGRAAAKLPVIAQVADFTLTNQAGRVVTLDDLRDRVWVADIIFTRCAGPCPQMTRHMKQLQEALPSGGSTRLVTLTTDPAFDTPPVMKDYAERFGAIADRWWFLTGTKEQIARLAIDSLKLTAVEKEPGTRADPQDLFIHSTIFVLVDKKGRLRAIFETSGEGIDFSRVKRELLSAVQQLEREA